MTHTEEVPTAKPKTVPPLFDRTEAELIPLVARMSSEQDICPHAFEIITTAHVLLCSGVYVLNTFTLWSLAACASHVGPQRL